MTLKRFLTIEVLQFISGTSEGDENEEDGLEGKEERSDSVLESNEDTEVESVRICPSSLLADRWDQFLQ